MHIDKIYSQQKATQMLRREHSIRSLGDTYQVHMSSTHANALVEKVEGRLNNFRLGKQIRHLIIFCFNFYDDICQHTWVFFLHLWFLSNRFLYLIIESLYTFVVLLSYLMLVVYISVPVCTPCGRGENLDEKYYQCILYFLRRPCPLQVKLADVNKLAVYYTAAPTLYFTVCGILNQPVQWPQSVI